MGKKGPSSWFSAIKGVFTSPSKHNPPSPSSSSLLLNNIPQRERDKKNKGTRFKHAFPKLLLSREPSSIEKILTEVDQHNLYLPHPTITTTTTTTTQSQPQPSSSSSGIPPKVLHSPPASPTTFSPPPSPSPQTIIHPQDTQIISHTPQLEQQPETETEPKPTLQQQHLSATKIQSAYRRHKSNRNVTTPLLRLQGVVKGQNVKRQTVNAMKQMQLLVRVQTQIHSRRLHMLDNQSLKPQPTNNNLSEMGDWDDSVITKEEREARLKKKVEAVTNRERAMSYAYSHQKAKPDSGNEKDVRNGGYPPYPWWWNSLERQLPPSHTTPTQLPLKNHHFASRLTPDQTRSHKQLDTPTTPMSSRSLAPSRTRQQQQQQTTPSTTPPNRVMMLKYPKSRTRGGYPMKDDDSLMSCPPFSVPNYMSPTVSAKAKARPTSNPRERVGTPSTPGSVSSSVSKRRFSFPFTPNSNRWNKHKSPGSVGDFSVNSANSVPASLGRKPFNRFV